MVNGRILRNKNASFLLVSPMVNHLFFLLFGIFYGMMKIEKKDKKGTHYVIRIAVVGDDWYISSRIERILLSYDHISTYDLDIEVFQNRLNYFK